MGFLSLRKKNGPLTLLRLPAGSFTVDRTGRVLVNTLPQSFPARLVHEIGRQVLETFRSAGKAQMPLSELVADYSSLKLTARELRGGAIVFLTPRGLAAR